MGVTEKVAHSMAQAFMSNTIARRKGSGVEIGVREIQLWEMSMQSRGKDKV